MGLLLPLSLCPFLLLHVFVFPSGLPDVPGYMPLSSWVRGTKPTPGAWTWRYKEGSEKSVKKRADESVNLQLSGSYASAGRFFFCFFLPNPK